MDEAKWQDIDIRLYAVAASLLLSLYTIILPEIPNDDAYTYIRTSEVFLQQGLAAAIAHYTWAGYSVLIALVSLLGFSLLTAAYLLNALFYGLLVYSFISIIKVLDDARPVVWLGALTILVFPEINEYRDLIIRDVGFWALSIFGLWQFLLYNRDRQIRNALYFCLALSLAVLFRAEAILYLVFTPLSLLFNNNHVRQDNLRHLLRLAGIIAALGVIGLIVLFLAGINIITLLIEFISAYQPFVLNVINPAEADIAAMGEVIFGEYASTFSRQYVTAVIAVGLLVVLFMNLFYAVSGPYFWLLVYGWLRKHFKRDNSNLVPVLSYLLINAIILFVFLYITRYLTSRYAVVFALMAAVQVPFVVRHILEKNRGTKWEPFTTYVVILFFFYCALDAYVSFGKPRDWLIDAANYVAENADPPTGVITNNRTIAYLSGRVEDYDQVLRTLTEYEVQTANPGDLIAIELFHEMSVLVEHPAVSPYLQKVAIFPSEEEPRAAIYRRINPI